MLRSGAADLGVGGGVGVLRPQHVLQVSARPAQRKLRHLHVPRALPARRRPPGRQSGTAGPCVCASGAQR